MKIRAESKKLVVVPDPPKRKSPTKVRKAIASSRLKFGLSWDELREITREP